MITEFLSVYSHFCSKILRIWQKFAVEYCSYKGFTRTLLVGFSLVPPLLNIVLIKDSRNNFSCAFHCDHPFVEYCSYKGFTLKLCVNCT